MRGKTLGAGIKLAIFALVTIYLTMQLAATISNGSVANAATYRAVFSDVSSLNVNDDVRIAGVKVGQISGIGRYADDPAHPKLKNAALVSFTVTRSYPMQSDASLHLRYRNLVGQRYLDIVEQSAGSSVPAGHLYPISQTVPALDLTALFDGFKPLFQALSPAQTNAIASEVIATLQGEGGAFTQLTSSTSSLTNALADRDAAIGSLISNLTTVLANVDQRSQNLSQIITQLQNLVTGLAGDRGAIAAALGNVASLTDSTARLVADIRPALPSDLSSLSALSQTLATTTNGDGTNTLAEFLQRLPSKADTITRTASVGGGWFNQYICSLDVASAKLTITTTPKAGSQEAAACGVSG